MAARNKIVPSSYYEKDGLGAVSRIEEPLLDLPLGWAWRRLAACCCKGIKRGKSPKYAVSSGTLVFAQKCNTKGGGIDLSLAKYLDESTVERYPPDEFLRDSDIVINSTGTGTLGRVGVYRDADNAEGLPVVPDSHVTTIRVSKQLDPTYVYCLLKRNQGYLESKGEGSTNQKELRPYTLAEMLVPIPPAEEQRRIAQAIQRALGKLNEFE